MQKLLFPPPLAKYRSMLIFVISTCSFDPDAPRFESISIYANEEKKTSYFHFSHWLMGLREEMEPLKPRGGIEIWIAQRSEAKIATS